METKIGQISELSNLLSDKDSLNHNLIRLLNRFGMGRLLQQLSIKKEKGASAGDLILLLCLFRMNGQSIFRWYRNSFYHLLSSGKNCFYRLLSRSDIDWRRLLYAVSRSYNRQIEKEKGSGRESKTPICFITVDTFLEKTGCCIERVSRVFDHVQSKIQMALSMIRRAWKQGMRASYNPDRVEFCANI
jgi:hypothetical protein